MARDAKTTGKEPSGERTSGNKDQQHSTPEVETDGTIKKSLDDAKAEAERYKDQWLRKAAEFENYKRRTDSEWQSFQRIANEQMLLALLPILDDLARSLKGGSEAKNFDSFYQGVELIYNKFLQTLKSLGVEPIQATGKPFNVAEHDALLQVPRQDVPAHTVLEEVEKGYRLFDRVLRHAKVVVSAEQTTTPADNGRNGEEDE
jgi:molecular chaperone GrpE